MFRKYIICLCAMVAGGRLSDNVYSNMDLLQTAGFGPTYTAGGKLIAKDSPIAGLISGSVTIALFSFCPPTYFGILIATCVMFATGVGIEVVKGKIEGQRINEFDIISRHIPRSFGTSLGILLSSIMGGTDLFAILGSIYLIYVWCYTNYRDLPKNQKLVSLQSQILAGIPEQMYSTVGKIISFLNYLNIIICSNNSIELIGLYRNSLIYSNMACKTRLFSVSFFLTIYFIEYLAWFLYSNEDKLLNGILAGSSFILIAMAMAGYVGIAFVVPTVILFQVVAWWESVNTY